MLVCGQFGCIDSGILPLRLVYKVSSALDIKSWDNWFPLSLIALFVVLGFPVALGAFDFGLTGKDVDRFGVIYTDIGIQTTAGIFAIVISLSLVAIQFAPQEYSHRIMEYYVRSVIFWSTLVVYLGISRCKRLLSEFTRTSKRSMISCWNFRRRVSQNSCYCPKGLYW